MSKSLAIIHGICTTTEMPRVTCRFVLGWGTCSWFQVPILLRQLRCRPPFQTLNYQTSKALKYTGKEPSHVIRYSSGVNLNAVYNFLSMFNDMDSSMLFILLISYNPWFITSKNEVNCLLISKTLHYFIRVDHTYIMRCLRKPTLFDVQTVELHN